MGHGNRMRSSQTNLPQAILCMDLDGTLVDEQVRLHPNDVDILSHFPKNILPVIATGRDLQSVKSILQENGLYLNMPFPLAGVYMNGGVTYLPGEVICQTKTFSPQARQAVISLADSFPRTAFTFFGVNQVYLVNPNPFGREVGQMHHFTLQETDLTGLPDEIVKVMVVESDPNLMIKVKQSSQGLPATMATSLAYTYEINPLGINKADGLLRLLKTLHLDGIPIFAAGDAENDLCLFAAAHTSFAPTTAYPQVMEQADQLITRDQAGLLTHILKHIQLL
ncbi:MAG: Cof-type HAD-IIB family hydrolase [Brevefilum sp.]|nr:Cof-type HAD-IIB family hydrolase [Brevefilum sp.]